MITIINYGMGNLGSVKNMFNYIGVESVITADVDVIAKAEKILLPGVGAFDRAMQKIDECGFRPVLDQKALQEKIPVLGICLGMQLLTTSSQEGQEKGLNWIPGKATKLPTTDQKVPNMGWSPVKLPRKSQLSENFRKDARFYFVHSYYIKADDRKDVIMTTEYGVEFDAGIHRDNIYGVQFHPEKSHKFGMQLLENFAKI